MPGILGQVSTVLSIVLALAMIYLIHKRRVRQSGIVTPDTAYMESIAEDVLHIDSARVDLAKANGALIARTMMLRESVENTDDKGNGISVEYRVSHLLEAVERSEMLASQFSGRVLSSPHFEETTPSSQISNHPRRGR